MKLRIFRKTTRRYNHNGSYWHNEDVLQYSPSALDEEWYNVPIVEIVDDTPRK